MSFTRRHLITASAAGGAAAALAACGGDDSPEPSAERDTELLQQALDAQATLLGVTRFAETQRLAGRIGAAVALFAEQAADHVDEISTLIEDAGGEALVEESEAPDAESAVEAIAIALEDAVAAGHDIVADLSTVDSRRTIYAVIADDAAQLAAVRGVLGEDQAPVAFVTGGSEPPLTAAPAAEEAEDE